jgi:hypothetical protein
MKTQIPNMRKDSLESEVNRIASHGHDISRNEAEPPRYYISRHCRALMVHSWMALKTLLVHIGRSA